MSEYIDPVVGTDPDANLYADYTDAGPDDHIPPPPGWPPGWPTTRRAAWNLVLPPPPRSAGRPAGP